MMGSGSGQRTEEGYSICQRQLFVGGEKRVNWWEKTSLRNSEGNA